MSKAVSRYIFLGIIVGIAITIIVVAAAYYLQIFFFKYTRVKICTACDQYINPGDAITNGNKINEILKIEGENMFYKRIAQVNTCIQSSANSIVAIKPQYGRFTTVQGFMFEAKSTSFGSPVYVGSGYEILTEDLTCNPIRSNPSGVISGIPILKWDPTPSPNTLQFND